MDISFTVLYTCQAANDCAPIGCTYKESSRSSEAFGTGESRHQLVLMTDVSIQTVLFQSTCCHRAVSCSGRERAIRSVRRSWQCGLSKIANHLIGARSNPERHHIRA